MTETPAQEVPAEVSEDQVLAYLERHPEFFERHETLLQRLRLPHDSGQAISLVERQVHLFREQRDALREELSGLIAIARQNDQLFARSKRLLMQLLEAQSVDEIAAVLDECIRRDFSLGGATLLLFAEQPDGSHRGALRYTQRGEAEAIFGPVLDDDRPLFGRLRDSYKQALFANPEKVGSAVVIPIRRQHCLGLIAISSELEHYFDSSMGSLFLSYISDTLGRLLPPLIDSPPVHQEAGNDNG